MRYDLFKIYIKNHDVPYLYFLSVAVFFLLLRNLLYGIPDTKNFAGGILLISVSGLFIFLQTSFQNEVLTGKIKNDNSFYMNVTTVIFYKTIYIVSWLIILFFPLKSDIFYDHILGYIFLFFMIATSTSSSSPYFPLFIVEILISVLFGLWIWSLNQGVQETFFATFFLCSFAVYALFMGRKINLSAIELVSKRQESEIAAKKSEKESRIKSDFLAFMSHEIRTPISGILGMTHFLKETPLSEEQKKNIDTITGCSETLLNTLNDAIDITKIESGKLKIQKKDFDLYAIFKNSMKIIESLAQEKNLKTDIEIDENVPQYIRSDPYRLQQIVTNLLNNAVKFTNKGSITIKVTCSKDAPQKLHVKIIDTGIGISQADQKRLFMQFSQIENENSSNYIGFGLGLSISKNLVSLMKGTIGVQSEENKGTTFWFEIPYERVNPLPEKNTAVPFSSDTKPLNILIVEDNQINLMIALRLLEVKGHLVRTAQTDIEAIEKIRQEIPDLILMDLNISNKDGIQIAQDIFAMEKKYAEIPIILVTANPSEKILDRCKKAGIKNRILKPYAPQDLYLFVNKYGSKSSHEIGNSQNQSSPNPKLAALLDVFGPNYTELFLNNSIDEANSLMANIETFFQNSNFEEVSKIAHDLMSVSGSLGLEKTYKTASDLEKACLRHDAKEITDLFYELKAVKSQEEKNLMSYLLKNTENDSL